MTTNRYVSRQISDKPCQGERFGADGLPQSCGDTPVWKLVHSSGRSMFICEYHVELYWNIWLPFRDAVRDIWQMAQPISQGITRDSA